MTTYILHKVDGSKAETDDELWTKAPDSYLRRNGVYIIEDESGHEIRKLPHEPPFSQAHWTSPFSR